MDEPRREKKHPKREKMYGWYDPSHLIDTGVRVSIATIFGEFLDRREVFAGREPGPVTKLDPEYDYSATDRDGFWFDYAADTGDGWDSTASVARMLACEQLTFTKAGEEWIASVPSIEDGKPNVVRSPGKSARTLHTKMGRFLVLGGDEVYATASISEYEKRFQKPFEYAAELQDKLSEVQKRDVYALPGNHDWYDGLNAFTGLFCARRPGGDPGHFGGGRRIGYRRAKQTRSYFALKLPHNWWLLGTDSQLSGYIDRTQVDFFDDVAQNLMPPGSNVILCVGTPSWAYVGIEPNAESEVRNLSFLEAIVTGTNHDFGKEPKARRHNLRLVLTGDAHHYTRFMETLDTPPPENSWDGGSWRSGMNFIRAMTESSSQRTIGEVEVPKKSRCYLTWGGGGAFLHPTWSFAEETEFLWDYRSPPPVDEPRKGDDAARAREGAYSEKSVRVDTEESEDAAFEDKPFSRRFVRECAHPSPGATAGMTFGNLFFWFNNPWFGVLMGLFAGVVTWALTGTSGLADRPLPQTLANAPIFWDVPYELGILFFRYPWMLLTCVALIAALRYLSAARGWWFRWIAGALHFLAHFVAFLAFFVLFSKIIPNESWASAPILIVAMGVTFFFVCPTIFGLYFIVSFLIFEVHWNEAFSALRIKDYKGFLRLHVDAQGTLTIYPIVADKIPDGGEAELNLRLIEGPIVIRPPKGKTSASARKPVRPRRKSARQSRAAGAAGN